MYIDGWWIYFAHDYVRGMLRALFVGINHKRCIHTSEQLSVHSPEKSRICWQWHGKEFVSDVNVKCALGELEISTSSTLQRLNLTLGTLSSATIRSLGNTTSTNASGDKIFSIFGIACTGGGQLRKKGCFNLGMDGTSGSSSKK
jgi:hypothetical protein